MSGNFTLNPGAVANSFLQGGLGAIFGYGIGGLFNGLSGLGYDLLRGGAHALSGGVQSIIFGGDFGQGAISGLIGSVAGEIGVATGLSNSIVGSFVIGGVPAAITAQIMGGDPFQAFITGGTVAAFNHAMHKEKQQQGEDVESKRESLATRAELYKFSDKWAKNGTVPQWRRGGSGTWGKVYKCSIFVDDVLNEVGMAPDKFLEAGNWGDPKMEISGWSIVDGPVRRGDIVAYKHQTTGASGHVGIGVSENRMLYQNVTTVQVASPWKEGNHTWIVRRYTGNK